MVSWAGHCVSLSHEKVRWLKSKPNVQGVCDVCLAHKDTCVNTPTEAKLNSLFAEFRSKLSSSIADLVPQLIKDSIPTMHDNVKETVTSAFPSYSDIVTGNKKNAPSTEIQFVIAGLFETESTYFQQVETDSMVKGDLVQHRGLQADGNILSIWLLGKIAKQHSHNIPSSQRRYRPILITTSNSYFMENCFCPQSLFTELKTSGIHQKFLIFCRSLIAKSCFGFIFFARLDRDRRQHGGLLIAQSSNSIVKFLDITIPYFDFAICCAVLCKKLAFFVLIYNPPKSSNYSVWTSITYWLVFSPTVLNSTCYWIILVTVAIMMFIF